MTSSLRRCGNLSLYVTEQGRRGPLVILLHGFPDFSLAWRYQVPALVAAGYRVAVPDQRGYNLSDKPKGIAAYDLDRLAGDAIALAAACGEEQFDVVGHDWGASVAWWLASNFPEHVGRAAMINAPHPAVWRDAMQTNARQKKLRSYVGFLGLPWLPEMILRAQNFKALVTSIRSTRVPIDDTMLGAYSRTWAQPGALTAMVNWYRALLKRKFEMPAPGSITTPALVIWGRDDAYAIPELAEWSAALCRESRVEFLDEAGHWAMWDRPDRVNALLIEFLAR